MSHLAHDIVALLATQRRALHVREIAVALGIGDHRKLADALAALVVDGVVRQRTAQRFRLAPGAAPAERRELEGVIHVNPKGFGFLRVEGLADDVFVPADALAGAMHGDRVRARVVASTRRGLEGEVVAVIARGSARVVGTLRGRRTALWLEPDDARVRGPIEIEPDDAPIAAEAHAGAAAVVEIVRYPSEPRENPRARLLAVLGEPGKPEVEVAKILLEHGIDEEHPAEAVSEARALGEAPDPDELARREDLGSVPLVTIDPPDARDHDDAVWAERDAQGRYRALIAIADVSHYVVPGSALDAAALARGNSVYLPDRAVPMLPAELSSVLCSLLPGQRRLCLCVECDLDPTGKPAGTRIFEASLRSHAFLTYDAVARALGLSATAERDPEAEAMRGELGVMWDLASLLRRRRLRRGALDFELPEPSIVLDEATGAPIEVRRRAADPGVRKAYRLVEELMLLANESVARFLCERGLPAVFRIHGPPDPDSLGRFAALCAELGVRFDPEDAQDPKSLSRLLREHGAHPKRAVLNVALLRAMQQAAYDVVNIGHFGLASPAYLHFTSPIRRYADLVVHRLVHGALRGEKLADDEALGARLAAAATVASGRERASVEAERAVAELYRALYMRSRLGEVFTGQVAAISTAGIFVQLDEPFVVVMVRYEDLGTDSYEPDDAALRARGLRGGETVTLGDEITVSIVDVSVLRRTVYAKRVVVEAERPARGRKTGRRQGRGRPKDVRRKPGSASRPSRSTAGPRKGSRKRRG